METVSVRQCPSQALDRFYLATVLRWTKSCILLIAVLLILILCCLAIISYYVFGIRPWEHKTGRDQTTTESPYGWYHVASTAAHGQSNKIYPFTGISPTMIPRMDRDNVHDCSELFRKGLLKDGLYAIRFEGSNTHETVFCDMLNGGWTLIMRHNIKFDKGYPFDMDWSQFKWGFGNKLENFWLSNELVHRMTNSKSYRLQMLLQGGKTGRIWTRTLTWARFWLGDEKNAYSLHVTGFKGKGGDLLNCTHWPDGGVYNGMSFSTKDRDNDRCDCQCAQTQHSGWWWNNCGEAKLTKDLPNYAECDDKMATNFLNLVEMKIKPISVP